MDVPDEAGTEYFGTRRAPRTALVAVHTVAALRRLLTVIGILERDDRVEVVYTAVPDHLGRGVKEQLATLGANVIGWEEATGCHPDLLVSASLHRIEDVPARRRLAMPHGAGYIKRYPSGPGGELLTYGLEAGSLVHDGRVVVDALVVSHHDQIARLRRQCPEAARYAVEGGDPVRDVLVHAKSNRERFRAELGVRSEQRLMLVSSTWGTGSIVDRDRGLLVRMMRELPANHRVVLTLHPAVWARHGRRTVLNWLRHACDMGLDVEDFDSDWTRLLLSADLVLSDAGSLAVYAAAVGIPVLLTEPQAQRVDPKSMMGDLVRVSPVLRPAAPLRPQLECAQAAAAEQQRVAGERLSSVPDQATSIFQRTAYRLLDLPEPGTPPRPAPLGHPRLVDPALDEYDVHVPPARSEGGTPERHGVRPAPGFATQRRSPRPWTRRN
ncbi:MAG: hypothetical protein HOV94_01870 [Saccharothrix sp.]|nr:hypothetical protein [Saccharothrix sp.]